MKFRDAKTNPKRRVGQPAVALCDVSVVRGERTILQGINWTVKAGACAAILGPNGSGKSTLVRVIMGQMWPTHGEVAVLGNAFGQTDLNELRQSIRLVQTNGAVEFDPDESAQRVVLTGFFGTVGLFKETTPAMQRRADRLIHQVGLSKEAQQPFKTLSSGERMRCLIARALAVKPKLLILDEPTAGLDLLAREQVLATVHHLIRKTKRPPAVLMITHHVEELLPETSAVLVLKDGQVAASGLPKATITSAVLSSVYDCPVEVRRRDGRFWLHVKSSAWKQVAKRFD